MAKMFFRVTMVLQQLNNQRHQDILYQDLSLAKKWHRKEAVS